MAPNKAHTMENKNKGQAEPEYKTHRRELTPFSVWPGLYFELFCHVTFVKLEKEFRPSLQGIRHCKADQAYY
jgi:hypothetical protein